MRPIAQTLYTRLCAAPRAWLVSRDGRRLVARAARLVKSREGRPAARVFINLIRAAEAVR